MLFGAVNVICSENRVEHVNARWIQNEELFTVKASGTIGALVVKVHFLIYSET